MRNRSLPPGSRPARACRRWRPPRLTRPSRIKFIVPFPAGSGTDTGARVLGQWLTAKTGQPVIVDNRPGASGFIAAQAAAAAAPDGYTVLLTTNTTHAANPAMFKKLPYDPVKDFEPVSMVGSAGLLLLVPADSPHKDIALVPRAAARRRQATALRRRQLLQPHRRRTAQDAPPAPTCWRCRTRARRRRSPTSWAGRSTSCSATSARRCRS